MQPEIDLEEYLKSNTDIEELLFRNANFAIRKSQKTINESIVLTVGTDLDLVQESYRKLELDKIPTKKIGMFSSGTTKGSQTLCVRDTHSIYCEVEAVEAILSDLHSKTILILVTPNHSFGLIPALLLSRRVSTNVFLTLNMPPLEQMKSILKKEPQVIFAVPAHIRMLTDWMRKKNCSLPRLERIIYAGAALSKEQINFFEERNIQLSSVYGTTQTGAIAVNPDVRSDLPSNSGYVLQHLRISFSEEKQILVHTTSGECFATGDVGFLNNGHLTVEKRIDSIVFKNGNKIDLQWLEMMVRHTLEIETASIRFEKNINGQSEIICCLPQSLKNEQLFLFEKLRNALPAYALPSRFEFTHMVDI